MGEEQCCESLVSILIYQGHSVSISDLTLSSLCFPLSIFLNDDNRMAHLNWPITSEFFLDLKLSNFPDIKIIRFFSASTSKAQLSYEIKLKQF